MDWTLELGWIGFFIREIPALFFLSLAGFLHAAAAKGMRKGAPSPGFLAIIADGEELTERGENARRWSLGLYFAGVWMFALTIMLTGAPELFPEPPSTKSSELAPIADSRLGKTPLARPNPLQEREGPKPLGAGYRNPIQDVGSVPVPEAFEPPPLPPGVTLDDEGGVRAN